MYKILKLMATHPLNRGGRLKALGRFLRWQIASRVIGSPIALPFVGSTQLLVETGMTGATGNWYCGLHEPNEMGFVLHSLRAGELFVDVGANIGSYTILAAGAVGANVISVEPLPKTFQALRSNIRMNEVEHLVDACCCGISDAQGELVFTSSLDTMNRVAAPDEAGPTQRVPVETLDNLCRGKHPILLKIDVEGHEAAVLRGAGGLLGSAAVEAVVMETNGSGSRFGVSDEQITAMLLNHGYTACSYDARRRLLAPAQKKAQNTIFVRDVAAMATKCRAAPRYTLINGTV